MRLSNSISCILTVPQHRCQPCWPRGYTYSPTPFDVTHVGQWGMGHELVSIEKLSPSAIVMVPLEKFSGSAIVFVWAGCEQKNPLPGCVYRCLFSFNSHCIALNSQNQSMIIITTYMLHISIGSASNSKDLG